MLKYFNEDRHNSNICFSTEYNDASGILLIPKNSSTYIRNSLDLKIKYIKEVDKLYIPVREPFQRFISGFVEFISRAKRQGDKGRGNIALIPSEYDVIKDILCNQNRLDQRIQNFLEFTKEHGFIDPHIFPQTYFTTKAKSAGPRVEYLDASQNDQLAKMLNVFGSGTQHHSKYSIKDKSKIDFKYLYHGVNTRIKQGPIAQTQLFAGTNGLYKEYGSRFGKKRALSLFYRDVQTNVLGSSLIKSQLIELYKKDFSLWEQSFPEQR